MMSSRKIASTFAWMLGVGVVACSSSSDGLEGEGAGGLSFGASGGSGTAADRPSCVTLESEAAPVPAFLAFVFDKSLTMGGGRYKACAAGLKTFFADPATQGLSASLQFFPLATLDCNEDHYAKPRVAMRALPDSAAFATALDADAPDTFGTPTFPALKTAIAYAKSFRADPKNHGAKAAVVLVTDGHTLGCNSTTSTVSAVAAESKNEVQTFVVGLGDEATLNVFAKAGGTGKATMVSSKDPAKMGAELSATLANIRQQNFACSFKLPPVAGDKQLDLATVNVVVSGGGKSNEPLTYAKDCAGEGWRYDDPGAPTAIEICPKSCSAASIQAGRKTSLQIGCTTKGTDGRIPR